MKYRHLFILSVLLIVTLPVKAKSFHGLFGDITAIDRSYQPSIEDSTSGVLVYYLAHEFNNNLSGLLEIVYDNSIVNKNRQSTDTSNRCEKQIIVVLNYSNNVIFLNVGRTRNWKG